MSMNQNKPCDGETWKIRHSRKGDLTVQLTDITGDPTWFKGVLAGGKPIYMSEENRMNGPQVGDPVTYGALPPEPPPSRFIEVVEVLTECVDVATGCVHRGRIVIADTAQEVTTVHAAQADASDIFMLSHRLYRLVSAMLDGCPMPKPGKSVAHTRAWRHYRAKVRRRPTVRFQGESNA